MPTQVWNVVRLQDTEIGMVRGPNGTTCSAWLRVLGYIQPQNTKDRSIGTTQTGTVKSNERSLKNGRAGVVKVSEFLSQILLPQTTGRDEPQCRRTICNIFEVRMNVFSKSTPHNYNILIYDS